MFTKAKVLAAVAMTVLIHQPLAWASGSFLCAEPGGKRLVQIDGNDITLPDNPNKTLLHIDGNDILKDPHAPAILVVDDDDVRAKAAGVVIATFDGDDLRHARRGKVLINYQHPNLCPDSQSNRIYSVEGDALSKQQLVAALYLLKPEMFKLSDAEVKEQQDAMKEAAAEQDKLDNADQVAGKWTMLNNSGINPKVGAGAITVDAKKGDAYSVTFDHSAASGPTWTGVGIYKQFNNDKYFYAAYGTPKTIGLCVYEIKSGSLKGTWYPFYYDGTEKTSGTESLSGPATLDGDYKIDSAKAPSTGAAYTGTVSIKPLTIVGTSEEAKPYQVTWTIGGAKIQGIGIRSGDLLFVSSGTGADVNITRFKIENGTMRSDWFKLGSTEQGGSAAMKD